MALGNKRVASIDILRGITIAGMVLCASIGYNSGLPAWMFHGQTPPPDYAFHPEVAGITWVDLVFPFFLFAMGAAFPFALRRRMEKGESKFSLIGGLVKRWLTLTLFALILGQSHAIWSTTQPVWQVQVFKIVLWVSLFLALVRVKVPGVVSGWRKYLGTAVNLAGVAMLAVLAVVFTKWFGIPLNKWACDIIIMILAVMAVWGGLIWMLTKDNLRLRWIVILLIAGIKVWSTHAPEVLNFVPSCEKIGWFFSWGWLQYLLIVLPGSIIGDMILNHTRSEETLEIGKKDIVAGVFAIIAVCVQLWGLFTRNVFADFCISVALAALFFILTHKQSNVYTRIAWIGFVLMIVGIVFDPIDGGITKDYCNLSYVFTTGGMATIVTAVLFMFEMKYGMRGGFVAGVGQNPMLAYTVSNWLISPILALTGASSVIYGLSEGSMFWGLVQGILITSIMMGVTYAFTKLKLFWRS